MRQAEFLIEATASQATRLRPYLPYTQAQEDTDWTTRARVTAGAGAMAQRAPLAAVASAAAAESGALSSGIHPHSSASRINDDKKHHQYAGVLSSTRGFSFSKLSVSKLINTSTTNNNNNNNTIHSVSATSTPTAGVTT